MFSVTGIGRSIYDFFAGKNPAASSSRSYSGAGPGGVGTGVGSGSGTGSTGIDSTLPFYLDTVADIQERNQVAQAEQNRLEREFQAQSALDADRRWRENLEFSVAQQRELRKTQYQDYVDSLNQAGLNPMLAVYSGIPSTPSVGASAHSASGGNSNVGLDVDSVSNYYNTLVSSAFDITKGVVQTVGNVLGNSARFNFIRALLSK